MQNTDQPQKPRLKLSPAVKRIILERAKELQESLKSTATTDLPPMPASQLPSLTGQDKEQAIAES
ncbi:MAG: hypothetical protein KME16_27520 [Scytolyngbya sp. HA4215-MV1]|nr:hypothetical protein [Scytolyngbya sp. HA4215-MV1]